MIKKLLAVALLSLPGIVSAAAAVDPVNAEKAKFPLVGRYDVSGSDGKIPCAGLVKAGDTIMTGPDGNLPVPTFQIEFHSKTDNFTAVCIPMITLTNNGAAKSYSTSNATCTGSDNFLINVTFGTKKVSYNGSGIYNDAGLFVPFKETFTQSFALNTKCPAQ